MTSSPATNGGIVSLPYVRGWCPTLFEPMAAADGLLANVKPRVRGWTAIDLRTIAAAAELHGSGRFLLTNRGNLQVRGLARASAAAFAAAMLSAGLASADRDTERRRNVLMLAAQTCESEAVGVELEAWLETDPVLEVERAPEAERSLAYLPPKFCFAVTSDESHGDCAAADVCIHVGERCSWVAACAGDVAVLTEDPVMAVASITGAFLRLAAARASQPRRMKDLIAEGGAHALFSAAGLQATAFPPRVFAPTATSRSRPGRLSTRVGPLGEDRFGMGIPFGRADAAMLYAVAGLAERFGGGRLRPTVHRTFVLFGTTPDRLSELSAAADRAGLIVAERDPRLRVTACIGGSGCDHATVDVCAAAASLAPQWGVEGVLHVSGCAKGCAYPHAATVTLLAGAPGDRFYVLRDSRADAVTSLSMTLEQVRELLTAAGPRSSA